MTEWLKVHAWKACVRVTVPWVRIPLSPPFRIESKLAGLEPCALLSREPRQARKGATVSGSPQVPQVHLGPITDGAGLARPAPPPLGR